MYEQEDSEALISGYLDGELSPEDRQRVETRLADDRAFREEFERMKHVVDALTHIPPPLPPDEAWDSFLDGVYNRVERNTGWIVLAAGGAALAVYGAYCFAVASGSAWIKLLAATPVVGVAVLFVSVLRQRLIAAKTDRYSKEVKR